MGVADQLAMPGTIVGTRGSNQERQQARRQVARIARRLDAAAGDTRTVLDALGLLEDAR